MENLIKALQIFLKYENPEHPTHCEHDVLYIVINPSTITVEDKEELEKLGFFEDTEQDCFKSYKYGSC